MGRGGGGWEEVMLNVRSDMTSIIRDDLPVLRHGIFMMCGVYKVYAGHHAET